MDATAFEPATRALIEQFRATQVDELLIQREKARENADRDPAAYQAMLQVQTAIVVRMERLAEASTPWAIVWMIEGAIRRFKDPDRPESPFGDEAELAKALEQIAALVDRTWLAGFDARRLVAAGGERAAPPTARSDPKLVYAPLREGEAESLLRARFDAASLSSALAAEVGASPATRRARLRRARSFLELTSTPPSPADTDALVALYGAFDAMSEAASEYPPLAIYLHATATAGFHDARPNLGDPKLVTKRGRFVWIRSGFARAALIAGLARVRRAVALAFPGLMEQLQAIALGASPRGGAYRSAAVEPSASDDDPMMLESMGLPRRFDCALAHAWFLRNEKVTGEKGSRAQELAFAGLWRWHLDTIRRIAAECYNLVHAAASADPLYSIQHGAALTWASIQAIRVDEGVVHGREDARAACARLRDLTGRFYGVHGTLAELAKAVVEHRPTGTFASSHEAMVGELAAVLLPQGFKALYDTWVESLEALRKVLEERGAFQPTLWDSLNVFRYGPREKLRDREARARQWTHTASTQAASTLKAALGRYPGADLFFGLEDVDLAIQWIRAVRDPRRGEAPLVLDGVDVASDAIDQWATRATALGERPTAGELIARFAARTLPPSRLFF